MRYYYAELNESGVCVAVVDTHEPIDSPQMVAIESPDESYLFRTYADGAFGAPPEFS